MVAGLAHESGNALQRSQACLQMLANRAVDREDLLDLVDRIQSAQDHLLHLYQNVRGYAATIRLEPEPGDLADLWREAWDNLEVQRKGRDTVLRDKADCDTVCRVDRFRVQQVFATSWKMCFRSSGPGRDRRDGNGDDRPWPGSARSPHGRDNGPGLTEDQRNRMFDPFYTTKTQGTGLGLALARRIVEVHDGRIEPGNADGPGCEIVIVLPREAP